LSTDVAVRPSTNLIAFAEEAGQVHKIAQALATTSFVPSSMKGKPDEITGAILFGRELGMDPMTSLQTINVIQGRPTLTANAMRGLAMAAGAEFLLRETSQTRCVMSARGFNQKEWTTITWTMDQARALGLDKKDNWKNQPGVMLIARATSQLCRLVAANVLIGLPYSVEELRDLPDATDEQGQPVAPEPEKKTRTMRRQQEPYKAPEPELIPEHLAVNPAPTYEPPAQKEIGYSQIDDEKRTGPEEPVERPDMVTTKTRAALMAAFNDKGIRDRTARLVRVSEIVGREILTVNQITEKEARDILQVLAGGVVWPDTAEVPA
jgi:hypothetical protein